MKRNNKVRCVAFGESLEATSTAKDIHIKHKQYLDAKDIK